ncbi:MAG: hypothetical protein JKY56_05525 [Kofleriaceae bacterium]|nr:hypothetical protein [Kofleriaceae bacterium]
MSDNDKDGEEEFTAEEMAEAKRFAGKVDGLLGGDPIPTLMDAEQRELMVLSSMVASAFGDAELDAAKQTSIIDAAMAQAMDIAPAENDTKSQKQSVDQLATRRKRSKFVPAIVLTLVAAAAVLILYSRLESPATQVGQNSVAVRKLPKEELSRSSDQLVGQIKREASGHASSRIDQIYGSRMMGYRSLRYRRTVSRSTEGSNQ